MGSLWPQALGLTWPECALSLVQGASLCGVWMAGVGTACWTVRCPSEVLRGSVSWLCLESPGAMWRQLPHYRSARSSHPIPCRGGGQPRDLALLACAPSGLLRPTEPSSGAGLRCLPRPLGKDPKTQRGSTTGPGPLCGVGWVYTCTSDLRAGPPACGSHLPAPGRVWSPRTRGVR